MKLEIELVPDSCWYSNLRSMLPKKAWDLIRTDAYARANGKCMICGRPAKRLEAHERWSYDEEKAVQKLEEVIAVCHNCHEVIHIGRTTLTGREKEAESWFMKVNKCSFVDYQHAVGKANADHQRRNKVAEWSLDLTYLNNYIKG